MRILQDRSGASPWHLVLMFGLGMLGTSVRSCLAEARYVSESSIDFDWSAPASWAGSLSQIAEHCLAKSGPGRLSVCWAAGGPGFQCTDDEAEREFEVLAAVVEMVETLNRSLGPRSFDFHFVSSAGGLFEGQRVVDRSSSPAPVRPYGHLKQRQEGMLLERFGNGAVHIYRPSTVYGPMAQKARHGLINNLVSDGLRGRTTVLDAHVMALRDYVYFGDVGAYVARHIRGSAGDAQDGPFFLVSSRCASIFEVVRVIERVLHVKLRIRYDQGFGNHQNITFSRGVLPAGWAPTPLEVGVRQFVAGKHANVPVPTWA